MAVPLIFATINANGLRKFKTRASFFLWLIMANIDIIFVQETHCTKKTKRSGGMSGAAKIGGAPALKIVEA